MRQFNVAIVGATGAVGEVFLSLLDERKFPIARLFCVASARSAGQVVSFQNTDYDVINIEAFDFDGVDIAFFSAGGEVSKKYAAKAVQAGALVIDNTSAFRYDADVPLVVPEVNAAALTQYPARGIIANPNCSTAQMVVALKPLHDAAHIEHVDVVTYQSVSGSGSDAISELASQTRDLLNGIPVKPKVYPVQIGFNVIPHIDVFEDNGYTFEEMKMVWETQKIFNDATIGVTPTAVRVPVFYAHSLALHVQTREKLSATQAQKLLSKAAGIKVLDTRKGGGYPTPAVDVVGTDPVYVGRIREDLFRKNGLNLWVVADNLRKGAALNSIQIAEHMAINHL